MLAADVNLLTVVIVAIAGPLLLAVANYVMQSRSKQADWDRQDQVAKAATDAVADQARQAADAAARASEAADLLLAAQKRTAEAAEEVARVAAVQAVSTDAQLERIHTLVNSDMTAARRDELTRTKQVLVALKRVVALDEKAGRHAAEDDLLQIESATARADELTAILADRAAQQQAVEVQDTAAAAAAAAADDADPADPTKPDIKPV